MTALRGRRLDWTAFFQTIAKPHGIRIRLATADASSSAAVTAEKRVLRLVRSHLKTEAFALRRSFSPGPTVIECVFDSAALADALAREVGAAPVPTASGWATTRELVADERALRRLLKRGAETPRASATAAATNPAVRAKPDPVSNARSRLAQMSLEEQAAALFRSMTDGP